MSKRFSGFFFLDQDHILGRRQVRFGGIASLRKPISSLPDHLRQLLVPNNLSDRQKSLKAHL